MSLDLVALPAESAAGQGQAIFRRLEQRLHADARRVVIRPFNLAWHAEGVDQGRARALVADVTALDDAAVFHTLEAVMADFEQRHWQILRVFEDRFASLALALSLDWGSFSADRRQLIGAYLCHEYSFAAAALMNPSITLHPDQSGMGSNAVRIVMSMRAVGEGHISSIAFREGIIDGDETLHLSPQPPFATAATVETMDVELAKGAVRIRRDPDSRLSGTVIFPVTNAQANGLEDLRLTRFVGDDGAVEWIGTYTAYSGRGIRSELLRTVDFREFTLEPIAGAAAVNKGMALFPRKINGRYAMIGRQDGKNLYLLWSDQVDRWEGGTLLLEPRFPWEFIQIGNCGPPIELDEGWLVLTHGVGPMRKYSIGAMLLDKNDPARVLGRTARPLLAAADHDREGYVPNVVYTCGAMRVADKLFLPYGLADSSVAFAFADIADVLGVLV